MRYFTVLLLFLFSLSANSQVNSVSQKVTGTIFNDNTLKPIPNVNVINVNKVKGVTTDVKGYFELEVSVNDTLHIASLGYQSLRVRVTNDWLKNGTAKLLLTEKAIALEEVIVRKYDLTGYLEIDSKLIPDKENYRYIGRNTNKIYALGDNVKILVRSADLVKKQLDFLFSDSIGIEKRPKFIIILYNLGFGFYRFLDLLTI